MQCIWKKDEVESILIFELTKKNHFFSFKTVSSIPGKWNFHLLGFLQFIFNLGQCEMKCQWDMFSRVLIKKWNVKSHVAATLKSCTKLPSIDMKSSQHTPRKWTLVFNFLFTFSPRSIYSRSIKLIFPLHSGFKMWVVSYFHLCFEAKNHIFLTFLVCNFLVQTILKKNCMWKLQKNNL